ncbi:MAG: hypothetical protein WBI44_10570 [Syntrophaceticus sp.]
MKIREENDQSRIRADRKSRYFLTTLLLVQGKKGSYEKLTALFG